MGACPCCNRQSIRARQGGRQYHHDPRLALEGPVITTSTGDLMGYRLLNGKGTGFRGIPCLQFKRLEYAKRLAWTSTHDGRFFGPACKQAEPLPLSRMLDEGVFPPAVEMGCGMKPLNNYFGSVDGDETSHPKGTSLTVNVHTPRQPDQLPAKGVLLPVLAWFHGGGGLNGSNSMIDSEPENVIADGRLVVCGMSYRLGSEGFIHFVNDQATNIALRDAIAGLEWVRDNVALFGGDPNNVTIMGQSAGGGIVNLLCASAGGGGKAKGLFHGAISLGGPSNSWKAEDMALYEQTLVNAIVAAAPRTEAALADGLKREVVSSLSPAQFQGIRENLVKLDYGPSSKQLFNRYGNANIKKSCNNIAGFIGDDVLPLPVHKALASCDVPMMVGHGFREGKLMEVINEKLMGVALSLGLINKGVKQTLLASCSTTKEEAATNMLWHMREAFECTTLTDAPGDEQKWKEFALKLYDLLEKGARERGLPTTPPDIFARYDSLATFEDAAFTVARDCKTSFQFIHNGIPGSKTQGAHCEDTYLFFGSTRSTWPDMSSMDIMFQDDGSQGPDHPTRQQMHANFREMITSFCETKVPVLPGGAPTWRPFPCVMEVDAIASELHEGHPFGEIEAYQQLKEEIRMATSVVHSSMTGLGFESPPRCGAKA